MWAITRATFEPGQVELQHVPVQEEQGGERLVLGRRGDTALGGEAAEECCDFLGAQTRGIAPAVGLVVSADPAEVGFLGSGGQVAHADRGADALAEGFGGAAGFGLVHGRLRGFRWSSDRSSASRAACRTCTTGNRFQGACIRHAPVLTDTRSVAGSCRGSRWPRRTGRSLRLSMRPCSSMCDRASNAVRRRPRPIRPNPSSG